MAGFNQALAEQDTLPLAMGWYNATKIIIGDDGMVRFDNFQTEGPESWAKNQFINLNEQNEVTDALNTIRENTLTRIADSEILQDLLAKPEWDYDDRATWESHVSKIVSEEMNKIPGLDTYRIEKMGNIARTRDLSYLGVDMRDGTTVIEHDCETMRSLEGIVHTQVDKELLPEEGKNDNDLKRGGAYVAANGSVKYSIDQETGGHAFLISTLTGNIIEGTADPDDGYLPYNDTGVDYSFADFIAGRLATTQAVEFFPNDPTTMSFAISVYGTSHGDMDDYIMDKRERLIEEGDFAALKDATFDHDGLVRNEEYFKSAFYKAGKTTFTVSMPTEDESQATDPHNDGKTVEDIVTEEDALPTTHFDQAFFDQMYKTLEDNGFTEDGDAVVLKTDEGEDYLLYVDPEGGTKVYDVTGQDIEDATTLIFDVEEDATFNDPKPEPTPLPVTPEPEPTPLPVIPEPWPTPPLPKPEPTPEPEEELCTQLHNVKFAEFVDGKGILNDDSGYNDADALKDLVAAAKGLGLSEAVYGHIEEAMDDGKFLETATAINAINASHAAMQAAEANDASAIDVERAVVKTFFENITADSLITDTADTDDKTPFSKADRETARARANEMDEKFAGDAKCGLAQTWGDASDPVTSVEDEIQRQPEVIKHETSRGESYSALAERYYGSASPEVYNALAAHNGHDANNLPANETIEIPASLKDGAITRIDLKLEDPKPEVLTPVQ